MSGAQGGAISTHGFSSQLLGSAVGTNEEEDESLQLPRDNVTIKAIQLYQPSGRREVRLVYRVYTNERGHEGKSTRHQKSYSMTRFGVETAWAKARQAFDYMEKTNQMPDDIKLPDNALNFSKSKRATARAKESFKATLKNQEPLRQDGGGPGSGVVGPGGNPPALTELISLISMPPTDPTGLGPHNSISASFPPGGMTDVQSQLGPDSSLCAASFMAGSVQGIESTLDPSFYSLLFKESPTLNYLSGATQPAGNPLGLSLLTNSTSMTNLEAPAENATLQSLDSLSSPHVKNEY